VRAWGEVGRKDLINVVLGKKGGRNKKKIKLTSNKM
jgi:hypothetical protein